MKLENTTVGVRLGGGFSFVLLTLILVIALAAWRLHLLQVSVEIMVNQEMVKERHISEWAANTNLNGSRTFLVLELDDASRQAEVQKRIKETSARISEIQKLLDSFEKKDDERRFLELIAQRRSVYVSLREKIFKEKNVDADNARKLLWAQLEPVLNDYVTSIKKLTEYHANGIARMRNEVSDLTAASQRLLVILGACSVLFCIMAATLVTRSIRRQLGGEPAAAMSIANRIAQGDLAFEIKTRPGDTTSLMYAIKQMQESFARIVADIRRDADMITSASQQIATGNADLSSRTEEQASALEETASSMEELTSTVKQNADNATQANQLAVIASDVAVKGGSVVSEVVDTMGSINESAKRIVDIISVIDGIAFQTNILALNAAVEAARAGEQGKGFAVVASEVRNLAQRSAAAAKEIKTLIDNSVEKVEAGSKLVDKAGATMQDVEQSIKRVTSIVAEISSASMEQTAGIEQINHAISQMDHVTQQNAALVEEAAAASEAMRELAGKLMQVVAVFRIGAVSDAIAVKPNAVSLPNKIAPAILPSAAPLQLKRLAATGSGKKADWEEF